MWSNCDPYKHKCRRPGWDPRTCISNKFLGDSAVTLDTMYFENPLRWDLRGWRGNWKAKEANELTLKHILFEETVRHVLWVFVLFVCLLSISPLDINSKRARWFTPAGSVSSIMPGPYLMFNKDPLNEWKKVEFLQLAMTRRQLEVWSMSLERSHVCGWL